MGYFKITPDLQTELEPKIKKAFPNRYYLFDLNHYHNNRFILLNTIIDDADIHYEYYQGYVELHLEGKYSTYEYNPIWRELVSESSKYPELSWHRWSDRNQGRCRYNFSILSADDIISGYYFLSRIFDPILQKYANRDDEIEAEIVESECDEILPPPDKMKVLKLKYQVLYIKDLPFENFIIPQFQRPYKWGIKNVNQLINDLISFMGNDEYRLGTLVLHENNIVDGQQRIITLALLLYSLFNKKEILENNSYLELQNKIQVFWKRTKFKNPHSIGHVRENLTIIEERKDDLNLQFLDFLLSRCQFVVVQLPNISEAFQFFDSQNARGKDLEPHDLLKAFHLREIKDISQSDRENITAWQDFDTQYLVSLFLSLYRTKQWSRNNSGREFTKQDVDIFKGISLDDKRYPFYMQQIICHYFSTLYSDDIARKIDKSSMEFPFQIDQICINGSRFFDMIRHYDVLYKRIINAEEYLPFSDSAFQTSAHQIISLLNNYKNRNRKGDIYVRALFDCLLLYYVDRFGFAEINKITRKIFLYVYRIRLVHFSVQLSTIDNEAITGKLFRTIRDAKSPYDIINLSIPSLTEYARNADEQLKELF